MQRILITGANRGIGLELVRQLLQRPDTYILATCRQPEKATELHHLAQQCPGQLVILPLDVSDQASIEASVQAVQQYVDGLDVLINNAGISLPDDTFLTVQRDTFTEMLQVNAVAPLMMVRAYLDLLKAGTNPLVLNMSTQMGSMTWQVYGGDKYGYCTSKAALNMISRCLAVDLQPHGITTVMLHPGWVQTDMGSSYAPLTPAESVSGILTVLDEITPAHNGQFLKWTGEPHPW